MLNQLREIQVPLLAVLLIGACAAKARRAMSTRSVAAGISPSMLFPLRLRRPGAIAVCAAELSLGIALAVTALPLPGVAAGAGAGAPATYARGLTALLFLMAAGALHELRERRPEAGCGCFGDLSHTPVSWRTLARSALLSVAALASVRARPLRMPSSPSAACLLVALAATELAVLAALSPELGELMVRLGYSEPCEVRRLPVSRTLAGLRASSQWRRYRRYLTATEPTDVWREGCWRYAVFPGIADGRRVEVVFAVYVRHRRPPVRAAIVDVPADARHTGIAIPVQRSALGSPVPARAPVFVSPRATDFYRSLKETR